MRNVQEVKARKQREGRKKSVRQRSIGIPNAMLNKMYLAGSSIAVSVAAAGSAFAAEVPDAGSMMTVAFVAALVLLILVINAVFGVWVYKDARHRGMKNPVGWIVAVVITGVPGLIGYLIARPKGDAESNRE